MATQTRRVVAASSLGGVLEWYDYAVYGFFSVTLAHKYFPSDNPVASLLAVYSVFAVSAFTRPLGGILFGYLGDRFSRRVALMISIAAIGTGTTLIAVLPTYETVGILAPILLTLLRLLQGLAVGGEYTGASIYVAEHAPAKRRGAFGAVVEASTDVGFLVGSGIGALTASLAGQTIMDEWAWRVPFAIGGVLALVTLLMRRTLPPSPMDGTAPKDASPVVTAIRNHWRTLLHFQSLMLVGSAGMYTVFVYGTSFVEQKDKIGTAIALDISTVAMFVLILSALGTGALSDRIGRRPLFIAVGLAALLLSWPLFYALTQPDPATILIGEIGFGIMMGAAFGMLPATMAEMMPADLRCSGAGLSYNVCVALTAGTSPLIAAALV